MKKFIAFILILCIIAIFFIMKSSDNGDYNRYTSYALKYLFPELSIKSKPIQVSVPSIDKETQEKRDVARKKILLNELKSEFYELNNINNNLKKLRLHYNDPDIILHFETLKESHLQNIDDLKKVLKIKNEEQLNTALKEIK